MTCYICAINGQVNCKEHGPGSAFALLQKPSPAPTSEPDNLAYDVIPDHPLSAPTSEQPGTPETYCLGLLTEECGEVQQWVGKALRFGIDTPGKLGEDGTPTGGTARTYLPSELGDMKAAIEFACLHGVVARCEVEAAFERKIAKLTNPDAKDNLGRQLAPQPFGPYVSLTAANQELQRERDEAIARARGFELIATGDESTFEKLVRERDELRAQLAEVEKERDARGESLMRLTAAKDKDRARLEEVVELLRQAVETAEKKHVQLAEAQAKLGEAEKSQSRYRSERDEWKAKSEYLETFLNGTEGV